MKLRPRFVALALALSLSLRCAGLVAGACNDRSFRLWDVHTERVRHTVSAHAHNAKVFAIRFSADGATLVTGSTDRSLKVWDLAGGACRVAKAPSGGTLRAPSACNALDVADDGSTIVSGHQVTAAPIAPISLVLIRPRPSS